METNVKKINKVHFERVETLIKYIEQKGKEGLELKRKDVLNIVGVGEGDSAKAIFKILTEMPEFYKDRIIFEKRDKLYYFAVTGYNLNAIFNNEMVLENSALKIGNKNKFSISLTARQLIDLWKNQFITYNPLIQRGQIQKLDKEGNIIVEDICSDKNIKEISEKILSNNYITDTITLNVFDCELLFKNGVLTIIKNDNSEINVLDGQHRLKSLLYSEELIETRGLKVDLDNIVFPIQIENLSISKAQTAFSQFAKGLKISTTRAEYFNNIDKHNIMLKSIIEKSVLKDKVETIKDTLIAGSDKIVTFGTLINSFKAEFSEEELDSSVETYMIDYFNQLYSNVSALNNEVVRVNAKKTSLISENITFYGYMGLAKRLYSQKTSPERYISKINNIDLNKSSDKWLGKVLLQGKKGLTITNKKDTRKYLRDTLISLVVE